MKLEAFCSIFSLSSADRAALEPRFRSGRCGTGGVFFLADDLEKLGSEYYRNKEKYS